MGTLELDSLYVWHKAFTCEVSSEDKIHYSNNELKD